MEYQWYFGFWCYLWIGTVDFQARVHKYTVHFNPYYGTTPVSGVQLVWQYVDNLLLSDYRGNPSTGLVGS